MRGAVGVGFGLAAGCGIILVRAALLGARRSRLSVRLERYLDGPTIRVEPAGWGAQRVTRLIGGEDELARHLAAAGRSESVAQFRSRQATVWMLTSGGVALSVVLLQAVGAPASIGGGLLSAVLVGSAGPVAMQFAIRDRAARRRLRVEAELPAVAGLLSLCLSAGETVRGAIERVAASAGGVWAPELARLVADTAKGEPLGDGVRALSARLDVAPATRLLDTLELARERGAPVAASLRAQAGDLRADVSRRLVEAAGKRQLLMLAPVIFLILPVCVVFAFWPALVSLRLLS